MVGQAVEKGGSHFGIPKDGGPFSECKVRSDNYRGAFVELANQMEEQLPPGLSKWQILIGIKIKIQNSTKSKKMTS